MLHGLAPHGAETRIGDHLVRAREDRDRVELNGAQALEHGLHATATASDGAPEQALRAQGRAAGFGGGELGNGGNGHRVILPAGAAQRRPRYSATP